MCGLVGLASREPDGFVDDQILRRMCHMLRHRGPDDEGYYLNQQVGLGMRRLSIIDLMTGQQPVTNEDGHLWVVFNGEIYNYRELRCDLLARGHVFVSQSDTEVIVHAYEEYGDSCVDYLNGMYSFAIWDSDRHRLFIARDRLGIKPLYYWHQGQDFAFASEIKALLVHPQISCAMDATALDHFLALEYIPAPRTIFQCIYKLPPGHILIYEEGRVIIRQYWHVPRLSLPNDEQALTAQLSELIRDAVRMQLVSDVPVGAFLSGGIDSSTVVACMSEVAHTQVRTFSIGFEDASYNELGAAHAVATHFRTLHTDRVMQPDLTGLVERLIEHFDEPFADFSIFPTYLVSTLARESVKVVLSGDGGDEIFGGYDTYVAQQYDHYYNKLPGSIRRQWLPTLLSKLPPQPAKKGLINKAKRFVEGNLLPAELQHIRWMMFMSDAEKRQLYQPEMYHSIQGESIPALFHRHFQRVSEWDDLAQQQYVDINTYLVDDILTKVDRMTMAASLEARVPLLDHRIVEFALNLPPHLKVSRGKTKIILRRAMTNSLPAHVLSKSKQGFSIPLKHWLCGSLKPLMLDLLSEDTLKRRGYFLPKTVMSWMAEHLQGKANHSHRLWALMVFELWHRHRLEK